MLQHMLGPRRVRHMSGCCRICWDEADSEPGGALVAPCNCKGTVKYVHLRCLQDWQQALRAQRMHSKAHICELCQRRYKWPVRVELGSRSQPHLSLQELALAWQRLTAVADGSAWVRAYAVWKKFVLVSSHRSEAAVVAEHLCIWLRTAELLH